VALDSGITRSAAQLATPSAKWLKLISGADSRHRFSAGGARKLTL